MDPSSRIGTILDLLTDRGMWFADPPADPHRIVEIEQQLGRRIPAQICELLLLSDGGELRGPRMGISPFNTMEFVDQNSDPIWNDLSSTIIFAADTGSNIYFLDVDNQLGRGPDAVHLVDMGAPFLSESTFAAKDVAGLFELIGDGGDPADS